jgi:hypothetical protein
MTIPELVIVIKDIIIGIAAATTATVAVLGLKNWSRELKGKTEFEIGRCLLRATYKMRDQIRNCRSRFISAQEFPNDYPGATEKKSGRVEAEAYAHVYKNRGAPVWEALQGFDTYTLEAEALWGNDIRGLTDKFRDCVKDLRISIDAFISNYASDGEDFKTDPNFSIMIRGKVSAKSDEEDELSQNIFTAIQGIEDKIRPHLKRN